MSSVDITLLTTINIAVFISAVLVFIMQPGFMLLEAGSVSRKNAINNLFKNLIDFAAGGLIFWAVGYMTFSGEGPIVAWIAEMGWAQTAPPSAPKLDPADSIYFLFQLGFASAAVTISSGAVTGRISPYAYLIFAMLFTGVIYPVIGYAVWHPTGPLYGVFTDFAGGVVVHAVGAAAGLAGAVMLRPRLGYNGYNPIGLEDERLFRIAASHAPHNTPIAALGVMLLWIGWFGFNGGTLFAGGLPTAVNEQSVTGPMELFGAILVNTALAPCAAVVVTVLIQAMLRIDLNMQDILNSVIAGLVAVTAAADQITPLGAVVAGAGAAIVYRTTRFLFGEDVDRRSRRGRRGAWFDRRLRRHVPRAVSSRGLDGSSDAPGDLWPRHLLRRLYRLRRRFPAGRHPVPDRRAAPGAREPPADHLAKLPARALQYGDRRARRAAARPGRLQFPLDHLIGGLDIAKREGGHPLRSTPSRPLPLAPGALALLAKSAQPAARTGETADAKRGR